MFQVAQNNGRGQWRAFSTHGITPLAMTALVIGLSVASLPLLAQNHGHAHAGAAGSAVSPAQDPLAKLQPAQEYTCSMHP